jgi:transcriptional regulator GlxA family with amidase domain
MAARVVFVIYPDFQMLDLTGPHEVFAMANRMGPAALYDLEVVAPVGGFTTATSGIGVEARAIDRCRGPIDTLVICGGQGMMTEVANKRLIGWIGRAASRARRVCSVCTGSFLLAEAGLLEGRRATTHWSVCDQLAKVYEQVSVEADPIFVRDGQLWTSAGVTAGMDLALALVEDDHGSALAREVARWLVLFVQRPGGQAQFSAQLSAQQPRRDVLRELQSLITQDPSADLSVSRLAEHCSMSPRNFARAFHHEVGVTPAEYVESIRLETARGLLETTGRTVADLARSCGFGTAETFHRAFRRSLGVTPGEYRKRFGVRTLEPA